MHYRSYVSGVLTSCSRSWEAIALSTFFFDVSWISPPISNSSNMKYAFSKLNIISNSQTCNNYSNTQPFHNQINKSRNNLHCQNTYPKAPHSDGWSPGLIAHCHSVRWRNRNISWHICKKKQNKLVTRKKGYPWHAEDLIPLQGLVVHFRPIVLMTADIQSRFQIYIFVQDVTFVRLSDQDTIK